MTVLDQLPVSRDHEITVKPITAEPEPAETTELGVVTWKLDLAAGQELLIKLGFRVERASPSNSPAGATERRSAANFSAAAGIQCGTTEARMSPHQGRKPMFRKTASLASAAVLALGLGAAAASSAQAKPTAESATTAACALRLGSVTVDGAFTSRMINATAPITVGGVRGTAGVFGANQVQHISTVKGTLLRAGGETRTGLTVMGGALYSELVHRRHGQSQIDPHYPHNNLRIGGGWSNYRWIDQSIHQKVGSPTRTTLYAQRTNGHAGPLGRRGLRLALDRRGRRPQHGEVDDADRPHRPTAETFIANTRAGGLLTVTWPTKYNATRSARRFAPRPGRASNS